MFFVSSAYEGRDPYWLRYSVVKQEFSSREIKRSESHCFHAPIAWLRPATVAPLPTPAPVARHTGLTGHAPSWPKAVAVGVLFAGIVAALTAAYYRRKLADWRARLSAYKASKKDDDTPLPRETHLLIDGEVPLEDAAEGRVPQPGPPKPDGSFDPTRGRGLWGNEHGPVTPTPQPVDLAAWKQQDYQQLQDYHEWQQAAEDADRAFDAEVSGLTPEEWYQAEQQAVALRIAHLQQQAQQQGGGPLVWEQTQEAVEAITWEATLQPQMPYTPPEPVIEACPAGEAQGYREQMAEIQQAYTWAIEHDPDRIPEIAASMNHLAEEAAADGCKDVMITARVEGGRMTEIAWDIQEGKALGVEPLPPPDYVMIGGGLTLEQWGKLGSKVAGEIAGEAAGQVVGQVLTKPLEWLSMSGNLIWVQECNQVLLCRSTSVGLSPWPVTGKAGLGWVEGGLACEQTVAAFEQATTELEAGFGLGLSKLDFAGRPGAEVGLYTPQVATGAIVSEFLPSGCTIVWEGKMP